MPLFFVCAIKFYSLCKKNLELTNDSIRFPGISRRKYSISGLKDIHCLGSDIIFTFGSERKKYLKGKLTIDFEGDTLKTLSLQRIPKQEREKFLNWIESNKGELLTARIRNKVLNPEEEEYSFDPNGQLILAYDSHKKTRAFVEICKQYERLFWTVWLLCCTPLALIELPMLLAIPELMCRRWLGGETGYINTPQYVSNWGFINSGLAEMAGRSIGKVSTTYYEWLRDSIESATILWVLAVFCCIAAAYSMLKPNKLVINSLFMEKFLMIGPIRLTYGRVNWSAVREVNIKQQIRPKHQQASIDRTIAFAGNGNPFELSMDSLNNEERRTAVLKAIENWGSHCKIDPEIFQTLSPVQKNSYTELWLQSLNSPPKRERLRPLDAGDTLQSGKYKITRLLASGGQGIAYVAEKVGSSSNESFVVKEFMLPVYVDRKARSQAIERFENESNVLSSLNTDSIVKLEDHFIEDHRAYLVLEHIKGTSLRDLVKTSGALSEAAAMDLCKQMCEILSYLHEQDEALVHRDFTPDNLILSDSGKLKLIDFNVVHQSNTNKTSATIVGKHSYMPPEQFAGRPVPQSDLYALGATIYYLLSGEDPEAFSQSFLPGKRPELSPRWSEIISQCTALSLAERARSARELALMLNFASPQMCDELSLDEINRSRSDCEDSESVAFKLSTEIPESVGNQHMEEKELEKSWQS